MSNDPYKRRVVCADSYYYPHGGTRIFQVGIDNGHGNVEILSEDIVMYRMSRGHRFYVEGGGQRAYLTTGVSQRGRTFLETVVDATTRDNLGLFPTCRGDQPAPRPPTPWDPTQPDTQQEGVTLLILLVLAKWINQTLSSPYITSADTGAKERAL